jgi:hypothetical protein
LNDDLFTDRLTHCRDHLDSYYKYNGKPGFVCHELGTGWFPIVPLGFWLCGASEIHTLDLSPLIRQENLNKTLSFFKKWAGEGRLDKFLPQLQKDRLNLLLGWDTFESEKFGLHFHNGDATKLLGSLPPANLSVSNNVLEHVHESFVGPITSSMFSALQPGGVMSHFIDMSDHFAHADKSITIYNFLKFSDSSWKWINNSVQPMNRLRIYDYHEKFAEAGLLIREEISRTPDMEVFRSVALNEKFKEKPPEETAVSHSRFVFVKPD